MPNHIFQRNRFLNWNTFSKVNKLEIGFSSLYRILKRKMIIWYQRSKQRRALGDLDDRLLRDVGISRKQVAKETRKSFWCE
jgi:uncharacterized protein YjiS (DUF1127 family)